MATTGPHTVNWTCDWFTALWLGGHRPPTLSASLTTNDFNLPGPVKKHLAGKQFGTNTKLSPPGYGQFFLCQDTSLDAIVGYMFKCWWWLCRSLMCTTICYPCTMYTWKSSSRHQSVYYCLGLSFGALIPIHFSMGSKAESQTIPYFFKTPWNTAQTWLCYRPPPNPNTSITPPPPPHTHTHTHTHNSTSCRYILLYKKLQKWEIPTSLRGHTMLQILRINVWKK
jgi:hypothetical protein